MSRLIGDLKYAVRRLLQYPGFAIVVIATLAVGIGSTTAIFSLVQAVLLRPLPYPEPERLVTTFHFYPSLNNLEAGFAVPTYRDIGQRTHIFESYAVVSSNGMTLTGRGQAQRLNAVQGTANYFRVLRRSKRRPGPDVCARRGPVRARPCRGVQPCVLDA